MVSTPPRRGGKEKAPKWRGRGAGRARRRELGVEPRGRKDGEGRIDSNPNNNKAFKGRPRPALRLFLGGFWVKGSGWSITSCAETSGVGGSGGRPGGRRVGARGLRVWGCRRGWSFCDSARDLRAAWAGSSRAGVGGAWGAGSESCESRRLGRGRGGGTGRGTAGESPLAGRRARVVNGAAGGERQPPDSQEGLYFSKCRKAADS